MSNPVIVITGVSSGIGRATAIRFVTQGCRVFGTVRNLAAAQEMQGVTLVAMDVCDEASVANGIQTIIDQAKRIDVLVNSAGVTLLGRQRKRPLPRPRLCSTPTCSASCV